MSTLGTNLQTGGAQFAQALKNSQNNVSALLRQAGIIMPGGGAASGLGGAFDPINIVNGAMSPEAIAKMTAGTSYGTEGAYSEAYQAGSNVAADQAMQSRSRGIGGGGLAAQRQELALMQTQGGAANVTEALLTGLGEQYGNTNQAYANEKQRLIDEQVKAANEAALGTVTNPAATIISVSDRKNYTKKVNPKGAGVPKNPTPGQSYKGFVYRSQGPNGPGWYGKSGPGPIIPPGTTGV